MKNIYLVILGLAVLVLVSFGAAFGMSCHADTSGTGQEDHGQMSHQMDSAAKSEAVDAGNKICPVMGEPLDEASKATYEYEGKIYNFCCTMCIDTFKKEPQKYIDKVNQELQVNQGVK
ncbi:MAG: YHS domain-containing protein [Candidatus Omnitrophota bacterium]|nr:YHS domain-containing protein [Candidatus Omnitrophota bacterium]